VVAAPEPVVAQAEPISSAPVAVSAPEPLTQAEAFAVAPAPGIQPEPIASAPAGVTAKPEDILKTLANETEAGLSQVETQNAAPASTVDESSASSGRHPRRRRPQAEATPAQMELMQVETSAPAVTPAAEDTTARSHGPGRRRRTSGQPVADEPLVQVETQQ
jgi:hypothetical protein